MNNDRSIQLLQQQRILLEMEYAAEKEAFRKQTETIGIQRKVKRGDAWFPITIGKCFYNSLNQSVVEVFRNADDDTEHNFEYGRPLVFFTLSDDKPRYLNFTASVSYVDGNRMLVVLPSAEKAAEMASKENLGVQLSCDETSYRAMFDALDRVSRAGLPARPVCIETDGSTEVQVHRCGAAMAECHTAACRQRSAESQGCCHSARASRNRKDHNSR